MSSLDRNIFELQALEIRQLLATGTASIPAGTNTLTVGNLSGAATVIVNKISNGKIVVTVDGVAVGPSGVNSQFTLGNSAGQFNAINIQGSGGADNLSISANFDYSGGSVIAGNGGNDTVTGGKGNDVVSGGSGSDNLNGGLGNDNVDGGDNNDTMDGGLGNDSLFGQGGFDQTNYSSRTGALRVTLDLLANDGEVGIGEADNVQTEEVIGGAGNDTMTGSATTDADEFFAGGAGADSLTGNGGNDELTGSGGQDKLFGNAGDDFLQAQNNDQDTVNGGTGPGATDFDLANIDGIDVASGASPAGLTAAVGPLSDWGVPPGSDDPTSVGGDGGVIGSGSAPVTGSPSDLDTTFDGDGRVTQNLGWGPVAAAVDSQGRVVFVGTDNSFNGQGYGNDFAIARFTAAGALDTTFGTNGQFRVDFTNVSGSGYGNESDVALGVAIGPGDKIIIVGAHFEGAGYSSDSDSAVARLTNAGALDGTFNTTGRVIVDASTDGFGDEAHDAAVQLDDAIVVGGTASGSGTVFRLLDNGSPDTSFNGGQPRLITDLTSLNAVALQTFQGDGTTQLILLGGDLDGDLAIERLQPNGARDFNFGNNGLTTHDFSGVSQNSLNDLAVDASNNILAAADASNFSIGSPEPLAPPAPGKQQAVLAKFDSGGTFVAAVTHDATDGFASFGAVTVDSAGRFIAVGYADSDFLVERVTSAMAPDTTFSSNGFVLTDFGGDGFSDDAAFATRVVAGGKILAAGDSLVSESSLAAIARYQGVATSGNTDKEGNVTEVEEVINYQDLHQQPPPPEIQAVFDRISDGAKFYILSQPDDQGVARLDLGLLGDGNGDDKVLISLVKGGKDGTKGDHKFVAVNCNGEVLYYDDDTTTRIEIFTRGGNDSVDVKGDIKTPLLVDGGAGDDNIEGGKADDILLGGPDKDFIEGNEGRDIIIGGLGADNLNGKQDEDIIIAGTTAHDGNEAALVALSDEWGSKDNFNTRLSFLRGGGGANGSFVLRGSAAGVFATVFDDGAIDILRGDGGKDWFFAHTGGTNADIVTQIEGGDVRDAI